MKSKGRKTKLSSRKRSKKRVNREYEVIIVGAGVAGASAAYHLSENGVRNILVIDAGPAPGEGCGDRRSGTAVMKSTPTVKMMVQLFPTTCEKFISHHGRKGAKQSLNITGEGLKIQKKLAKKIGLNSNQLIELGTFILGYEKDEEELLNEFKTLKSLGCSDIVWYDKEMLENVEGCSEDFYWGIYFPKDAVIDSSTYAKKLLRFTEKKGSTQLLMNTRAVNILDIDGNGIVELESGTVVNGRHVIVATGGLFQLRELSGLLRPCYSYLVDVPVDLKCEYSSNFISWEAEPNDWCFTKGKIRISGEDHFSAYKNPKTKSRCQNLLNWTLDKYNSEYNEDNVPYQYGVYSETPDFVPLIGSMKKNSAITYLLGCNAWGQTVLSYSSSLIPGLLGYKKLTKSQEENFKLLTIRRFTNLPKY